MEEKLIIAFNITKTYDRLLQGVGDRTSIYDCTRHYWKVQKAKAELADLVFGVAHGRVVGVYKPTSWHYVKYHDSIRMEFEGLDITDSSYHGKDVSEYFHRVQNPVRYIGNW